MAGSGSTRSRVILGHPPEGKLFHFQMYTEAVVSRLKEDGGFREGRGETKLKRRTSGERRDVWTKPEKNHTLDPGTEDGRSESAYVERIKAKVEFKLKTLLDNETYKRLFRDEEILEVESLKKYLKNGKIGEGRRKVLELSLLILIYLEKNRKISKKGEVGEGGEEGAHKFDLCGEVVNLIVNRVERICESQGESLELLMNLCMWTVETSEGGNVVMMCYELLVRGLKRGFISGLMLAYIRNSILDKSGVVSHASYKEEHYQQIFWKLRILQVGIYKNIFKEDERKKCVQFAIKALNMREKSIYILDEAVCLLAQIWMIDGWEYEVDRKIELRMLTKLLRSGDESFLCRFSLSYLTKTAIAGPIEERKLALKCLSMLPEKIEKSPLELNLKKMTYRNNFRRGKSRLERMDLGLLTVGVMYIGDLKECVSYLKSLHNLANNIIYSSNKDGRRKRSVYVDFLVILKGLSRDGADSAGSVKFMKDRVRRIKVNLIKHYYSVYQLINGIIATRAYISSINQMAVKVDYKADFTLYLLLGMDAHFNSIRRDYIRSMTMSTNYVNFKYVKEVMEIIRNTGKSRRNKWVFGSLVEGMCSYLEVLYEHNLKDIYGINHKLINQMSEEIMDLFRELVNFKSVSGNFEQMSSIVSVLRAMCNYNELYGKRVVKIMKKIVEKVEKHMINSLFEGSKRYEEKVEGSREELLVCVSKLYERLSERRMGAGIHEEAIMLLCRKDCVGYVSKGLLKSIKFNATRELVQMCANQLSILQEHDWERKVVGNLRKLTHLVLIKVNRRHCRIVKRSEGEPYIFQFASYRFRIRQDSINKRLRELLKSHLVHVVQQEELEIFRGDYTLAPDVVQKFTHDCPGE